MSWPHTFDSVLARREITANGDRKPMPQPVPAPKDGGRPNGGGGGTRPPSQDDPHPGGRK